MKDEPLTKASWWNEFFLCAYHQNQGNLTNNCYALKGAMQKMIDDETIEVKNFHTNEDYTTFKNPFMIHEKGESSTKINFPMKRSITPTIMITQSTRYLDLMMSSTLSLSKINTKNIP